MRMSNWFVLSLFLSLPVFAVISVDIDGDCSISRRFNDSLLVHVEIDTLTHPLSQYILTCHITDHMTDYQYQIHRASYEGTIDTTFLCALTSFSSEYATN